MHCSSRGYPRLDLYTAFAVCLMRVEQFHVLLRTPGEDYDCVVERQLGGGVGYVWDCARPSALAL